MQAGPLCAALSSSGPQPLRDAHAPVHSRQRLQGNNSIYPLPPGASPPYLALGQGLALLLNLPVVVVVDAHLPVHRLALGGHDDVVGTIVPGLLCEGRRERARMGRAARRPRCVWKGSARLCSDAPNPAPGACPMLAGSGIPSPTSSRRESLHRSLEPWQAYHCAGRQLRWRDDHSRHAPHGGVRNHRHAPWARLG